jgi:hypothetical protein
MTILALALMLAASAKPKGDAERPLVEVLNELRAAGLPIVYSDDLVRPEMRVARLPSAASARRLLDEVLKPHGLAVRPGPGGRLLVVRVPRPQAASDGDPTRFAERVDVEARVEAGPKPLAVRPVDVVSAAGGAENVFRVAQTLPGVGVTSEVDARMIVRGGGPDQNLVVLDGVEIHNPYRLMGVASGFNPETIRSFDLTPGGFDARWGDRSSSLLVIESRRGTEERPIGGVASLGAADAGLVLEGKLPGEGRGSWLVAGRRTYYDLVAGRFVDWSLPRFADGQVNLTWTPRPGRALSFVALAGDESGDYSVLDPPEDYFVRFSGRSALAALSFETPLGRHGRARTVGSFTRFQDGTDYQGSIESDALRSNLPEAGNARPSRLASVVFDRDVEARDRALRQEFFATLGRRHDLALGFEAHSLSTSWSWRVDGDTSDGLANGSRLPYPSGLPGSGLPPVLDSSSAHMRLGAWAQGRIAVGRRLVLQPGVRVDWSDLTGETSISPRLQSTLSLGRTRLRFAAGVYDQSPGYEKLFLADRFVDLTSSARIHGERSAHFVAGVERELGGGLTGRAEGYYKGFRDLLVGRLETPAELVARLARYDFPAALQAEIPTDAQITSAPSNEGRGEAWGVDVLLARTGGVDARLRGWASYSYGHGEREVYGVRYPFDYDRRQAASVVLAWRLRPWLELSATGRVASGFARTPAVGIRVAAEEDADDRDHDGNRTELVPRRVNGALVYTPDFGSVQNLNASRLPSFARLDLRATFRPGGPTGRWTLYLDVINATDRENPGAINNVVTRDPTGSRPVLVEERTLSMPILPTLGVRFRF